MGRALAESSASVRDIHACDGASGPVLGCSCQLLPVALLAGSLLTHLFVPAHAFLLSWCAGESCHLTVAGLLGGEQQEMCSFQHLARKGAFLILSILKCLYDGRVS